MPRLIKDYGVVRGCRLALFDHAGRLSVRGCSELQHDLMPRGWLYPDIRLYPDIGILENDLKSDDCFMADEAAADMLVLQFALVGEKVSS